jgi:hypothetical protein
VPNNAVNTDSRALSACYPQRTFYPLIDSLSTQHYRVTMTDNPRNTGHPCATCKFCSQARLRHYTIRQSENHQTRHRAPPLLFRRRPPQSNYPLSAVLSLVHPKQIDYLISSTRQHHKSSLSQAPLQLKNITAQFAITGSYLFYIDDAQANT